MKYGTVANAKRVKKTSKRIQLNQKLELDLFSTEEQLFHLNDCI